MIFHIQKDTKGYAATLDSPDQGANGIPVPEITFQNEELALKMPALSLSYKGKANADYTEIEGTFQQGAFTTPLKLTRAAIDKPVVNRPQEPKEPFPYKVEDVSYPNTAANLTLAGTLTLPESEGPHPTVILISGSGPQNRDEELLNHKPFLVIADHLTRQGIGVLRFDDRGVAESTGDFKTATSKDFATDVQAGIDYLKTRKDIDTDNIGLVGHSEGGLIAPMVAAESDDVGFIVLLAGPGVPGDEVVLLQQALIREASGISAEANERNQKALRDIFTALRKSKDIEKTKAKLTKQLKKDISEWPEAEQQQIGDVDAFIKGQLDVFSSTWFRFFLEYDPKDALEKVKCPVLALNGEKDLQVDTKQNFPAIEAALKAGGNTNYTMKELPGLNHLFQHTETGNPTEYATIEETFAPEALKAVSDWILEVIRDHK